MMPEVAVAISGGVDSLVAAAKLKQKLGRVIGLHFVHGYEPEPVLSGIAPIQAGIFNPPDAHPLHAISRALDIPIFLVDCREIFQKTVVDYFIKAYPSGVTPNPCLICNARIKFGILYETARRMGASLFATGHYARLVQKKNQGVCIAKGLDAAKDQSYFLGFLPARILPHVDFPLGEMTKDQVLAYAKTRGLSPIQTKESQDVCFIPDNDYAGFIGAHLETPPTPGPITDRRGKWLGTHDGLHRFTIGQRRGIGCPAPAPYYVLGLDIKENRLIVGSKEELYAAVMTIRQINWFIPCPPAPMEVSIKIRYRHRPVAATLIPQPDDTAMVRFHSPQPAVTPGQGAVCYVDDAVIAGGIIHG